MNDAESLAADDILDALTREGPSPEAHRAAIERLAREWPTLMQALCRLADARGVPLPGALKRPTRRLIASDVLRSIDGLL